MGFRRGEPRPANAGRRPGSRNRNTRALKDTILTALNEAGGVKYLTEQALANPAAFLTLVGKVLPLTIAGDRDKPLEVKLSRAELAERAHKEIDEAFREWQPPGHEEERPLGATDPRTLDELERANGPGIEHRSGPVQDGDRSEPVAEADHPALSVPRESRPSSLEAAPGVARRSIPRRPRPVRSGWAG